MVAQPRISRQRWELLPAMLASLVLSIYPIICTLDQSEITPQYDAVELFAGKMAITNGCGSKHLCCQPFDKILNAVEDITTPAGFRQALVYVLRLKPNGVIWAAPECKTWIFIGRKGTGRSFLNPRGDERKKQIRNANLIAENTICLLTLAWLQGGEVFLEQPGSSLMTQLDYFIAFKEAALFHVQRTFLGAFNGRTAKPIDIHSTSSAVYRLARSMPRHLPKLTRRAPGGSIQGKRKELLHSAAYPVAFGMAVASLWLSMLKRKMVDRFSFASELFT
jgi:hypothetical protein